MMFPAIWLLQDLLSVLTWGAMRIPEIFLLYLVYRLLTAERDAYVSIIWTAFLGGLFWDLRWLGIPSLFTMSYVCVVLAVMWAWNLLPTSGRTPTVIFFLFWTAQLLPALVYILVIGDSESRKLTHFLVQQGCAVPLVLLYTFFYLIKAKDSNA